MPTNKKPWLRGSGVDSVRIGGLLRLIFAVMVMTWVSEGGATGLSLRELVRKAPVLKSIVVNPSAVVGSRDVTGTVNLTAAAPKGGLEVALTSSSPAATSASTVLVEAGRATAEFSVKTSSVAAATTATFTATLAGESQTAVLTVNPPDLISLTLEPAVVIGGQSTTAIVKLDAPAPAGGITINAGTWNIMASTPSFVTIPAGETTAKFPVSTVVADPSATDMITAYFNNVGLMTTLTIKNSTVVSFKIAPATVYGGVSGAATATLTGPTFYNGAVINVKSNNGSIIAPAAVLVPGGQSSVTFAIYTVPTTTRTTGTITVSFAGSSKSTTLTVEPPVPIELDLFPQTITGGNTANAAVVLSGAAPIEGLTIKLKCNNPAVKIPLTINTSPGQSSVNFAVVTSAVTTQQTATITATLGGISRSATLTITPK